MRADVRQRLFAAAEERSRQHPARVERAVERGMRLYRRRLALAYAVVGVGSLVVVVLATGIAATARDDQPTLLSIVVEPGRATLEQGDTRAFEAVGRYSDDSSRDLTDDVDWTSSDDEVVRIDPEGTATALSAGKARIRAQLDAVRGTATVTVTSARATLESIVIEPASSALQQGETQAFTAIGRYSDDTGRDLTEEVEWTSADPGVVEVDQDGRATAVGPGDTEVRATSGGVHGAATVTVAPADAVLRSIVVEPPTTTLQRGETQAFTAIGRYSDDTSRDLTDEVEWSSASAKVVQVDQGGLATAVGLGEVTVSAEVGGVVGTAGVIVEEVEPALVAIELAPTSTELCKGSPTQQLTATGVYDNEERRPLDASSLGWVSDNPAVATVDEAGLVTSPQTEDGRATIHAERDGVVGSATILCYRVD